jgi:hypothetical protein
VTKAAIVVAVPSPGVTRSTTTSHDDRHRRRRGLHLVAHRTGRNIDDTCDDTRGGNVNTTVTDEQVRQLAETAKPYSLALLWWGPERHIDGAEATESEHQRRMVSLRADGVIAILCPVASDTLAGVAIMTVPPEEATRIMGGDPCVRAGMMRCDVHPCHGFPGDALPA